MGTFGNSSADDMGKWNSNKEMDISANSSVTDDGLLESSDQDGEKSWRKDDESESSPESKPSSTGEVKNP